MQKCILIVQLFLGIYSRIILNAILAITKTTSWLERLGRVIWQQCHDYLGDQQLVLTSELCCQIMIVQELFVDVFPAGKGGFSLLCWFVGVTTSKYSQVNLDLPHVYT